jgi:protein-L-isoaspartate(D-aspartate) O-methyltransferase
VRERGPQELVTACRSAGVTDRRVLDAVASVPRSAFVPHRAAARAYVDAPLPIPHGQVTTQPSLVARMLEALALTGTERVLEVGTGYGWQTALLARLGADVWSVERFADVAETARAHLAGLANVHVETGDGTGGLPARAPFDAIVVSAAFPQVPGPLGEQLADSGRLVQPLGWGGAEQVALFQKVGGELVRRHTVASAHFVRLFGDHGFGAE